jgi:hypothetical protein
MHLRGEGVANVRDGTVDDGFPEHAGPVEINVTLRTRQNIEDGGRRRFDSA